MTRPGRFATLVLSAAVLATFAAGAMGATPSYSWRDGDSGFLYRCPGPPAGWTASPWNPVLTTPSALNIRHTKTGAAVDTSYPGSDQETVSCYYGHSSDSNGLYVSANLALPVIDVNPLNDFYIGCGSNKTNYTPPGIPSYIAESTTRYAYAKFTDNNHALTQDDLPVFEALTRQLLQYVEPAAHTCKLDTTHPVAVPALKSFGFKVSLKGTRLRASTSVAGAFDTAGGPTASNHYKVSILHVEPTFRMKVTQRGVAHRLSLHFSNPTFYYLAPVSRLVLHVTVWSSTVRGCPKGSHGTMTLTTSLAYGRTRPTKGKLDLCRSVFGKAKQKITGQILSG